MAESNLGISTLLQNQKLEPHVQRHLKNVYSCIAILALAAALGVYSHLLNGVSQIVRLGGVVSTGLCVALYLTPHGEKHCKQRQGYLLALCFLLGLCIVPAMEMMFSINPNVIATVFLANCAIFSSFTIAAMIGTRNTYMCLGGTLLSLLCGTVMVNYMDVFKRLYILRLFYIYGVLPLMCGYVMYDTQMIIERFRSGECDYISHAVDLFLNTLNVFRSVAVVMSDKTKDKKIIIQKKH